MDNWLPNRMVVSCFDIVDWFIFTASLSTIFSFKCHISNKFYTFWLCYYYVSFFLESFRKVVGWKELILFNYPEIINKPIDLGQVKAKIERDEYLVVHHTVNYVRLVWNNYIQYNSGGSEFYNLASALSKKFEEKIKTF